MYQILPIDWLLPLAVSGWVMYHTMDTQTLHIPSKQGNYDHHFTSLHYIVCTFHDCYILSSSYTPYTSVYCMMPLRPSLPNPSQVFHMKWISVSSIGSPATTYSEIGAYPGGIVRKLPTIPRSRQDLHPSILRTPYSCL